MKNLNDTIWFFDIDDTLIDTAKFSGDASGAIGEYFTKNVKNEFDRIFDLLLIGYQDSSKANLPKRLELLDRIEDMQKIVKEKYGFVKKWSREGLIVIALENLKIEFAPKDIENAANAYWEMLTDITEFFPGVIQLNHKLQSLGIPVFLITSSDARMKLGEDGQLIYGPKHSETLKRERIMKLKQKGLHFDGLSIGDPEDKPDPRFFEKGLKQAEEFLGRKIDTNNCIMVGDSFEGDLQTPLEKLDFGLVAHFKKGQKNLVEEDTRHISVGNLTQILDYFIPT